MSSDRPLISIVIPCHNEEENLAPLAEALEAMIQTDPRHRYEAVVVDDGSTDDSLLRLKELAGRHGFLRVVSLSRNFGSHPALLAGMRAARGDAVTCIAADLQDPPDLVPRLAEPWAAGAADIVWAERSRREDSLLVRFPSWLAHVLFRRLTGMDIPSSGLELFLADRKVVEAVTRHGWRNCSILMAFYWAGYRRAWVTYAKGPRTRGRSKWSLTRRLRLFIDTTVGFSYIPLRLMSGAGFLAALVGFGYAAAIAWLRLQHGNPVQGWASTMTVVLVLGGLILSSIGVLGEYLWRTLEESRERPMYLVREEYPPSGPVEPLPEAAAQPAATELA